MILNTLPDRVRLAGHSLHRGPPCLLASMSCVGICTRMRDHNAHCALNRATFRAPFSPKEQPPPRAGRPTDSLMCVDVGRCDRHRSLLAMHQVPNETVHVTPRYTGATSQKYDVE